MVYYYNRSTGTTASDLSADEKRQSLGGFSEGPSDQSKDKLNVSAKAISALFLSKVAPQEPTGRLSQPVNI